MLCAWTLYDTNLPRPARCCRCQLKVVHDRVPTCSIISTDDGLFGLSRQMTDLLNCWVSFNSLTLILAVWCGSWTRVLLSESFMIRRIEWCKLVKCFAKQLHRFKDLRILITSDHVQNSSSHCLMHLIFTLSYSKIATRINLRNKLGNKLGVRLESVMRFLSSTYLVLDGFESLGVSVVNVCLYVCI